MNRHAKPIIVAGALALVLGCGRNDGGGGPRQVQEFTIRFEPYDHVRDALQVGVYASPEVTHVTFTVDGLPSCMAPRSGVCRFDVAAFPEGAHEVQARATTSEGTRFAKETFTVDRTPPKIVGRAPLPGADHLQGCPIEVDFDEVIDRESISIQGDGLRIASADYQRLLVALDPPSIPMAGSIRLTVQDLAGNPTSAEWTFAVPSTIDQVVAGTPTGRTLSLERAGRRWHVGDDEVGGGIRIHDACTSTSALRPESAVAFARLDPYDWAALVQGKSIHVFRMEGTVPSFVRSWEVATEGVAEVSFEMNAHGAGLAWRDSGAARCTHVGVRKPIGYSPTPTWQETPELACASSSIGRPAFELLGGVPVLSWVEPGAGGGSAVRTLAWNGASWRPIGSPVPVPDGDRAVLATSDSDYWRLFRARGVPGAGLVVEVANVSGQTWTALPGVASPGAIAKGLIASKGVLHLLWQEPGAGSGHRLQAASLPFDGSAWVQEMAPISFATTDPGRPAAFALDTDGRPVVAWIEEGVSGPQVHARWGN
ncbi:MAG: hypothetical protein QM704_14805 [Anaeromyxobacteraceae bacterium]